QFLFSPSKKFCFDPARSWKCALLGGHDEPPCQQTRPVNWRNWRNPSQEAPDEGVQRGTPGFCFQTGEWPEWRKFCKMLAITTRCGGSDAVNKQGRPS